MIKIKKDLTKINQELSNFVSTEYDKTKSYDDCEIENDIRYLIVCCIDKIDKKKIAATSYKNLDVESKKHIDAFFKSYVDDYMKDCKKDDLIAFTCCLDKIVEVFTDTFLNYQDIENILCK